MVSYRFSQSSEECLEVENLRLSGIAARWKVHESDGTVDTSATIAIVVLRQMTKPKHHILISMWFSQIFTTDSQAFCSHMSHRAFRAISSALRCLSSAWRSEAALFVIWSMSHVFVCLMLLMYTSVVFQVTTSSLTSSSHCHPLKLSTFSRGDTADCRD